ncbi:MAG: TolC family protein [Microscillaceae bacterium]|nr:TolC family protein [Microscillaceae bacterium]
MDTIKKMSVLACLLCFTGGGLADCFAQNKDSLIIQEIGFEEAKSLMLKNNLQLIAAYYDISIAEADIIQSKLWANPYFVWNQDMYSNEKNEYFDFTNQRLIQINQTFSVAGKHTNTVKLAKKGKELNELMLLDVTRSLVYELGERYLSLFGLQEKQKLYEETQQKYLQLIASTENKLGVGAVPLNEVTRLRSELIAIRSEAIHNRNEISAEMKELKILLNLSDNIYLQTSEKAVNPLASLDLENLQNEALTARADYLISKKQIEYEEQNLRLQRSLAMPDIMLGYQPSDKGSNYVRPYHGLVLEMNIPIFDRNQGNIRKARVQIDKTKSQNQFNELNIRNEVTQSLNQLQNSREGYDAFSDDFMNTIDNLNQNSQDNYDKRNINLLEYIDLQRIYIQNRIQYIDLKNEYQKAVNLLNFTVGKEVID